MVVHTPTVTLEALSFEHYPTPLGVSHSSPRLSWRFSGDAKDWAQTAYDVRLTRSTGTTTDSVISGESVLVPWPATPLSSRERVLVEVRACGTDGQWTAWIRADVEAALLNSSDWQAKLASASDLPAARDDKPVLPFVERDPGSAQKPFRLRTTFQPVSQPTRARLYVTACGIHNTFVNGKPVSPDLLQPGWTSYDNSLPYRVYDVTSLLKADGTNVLASWIGEGWYTGRVAFHGGVRHVWGWRAGLIAQLEVDGKVVAATNDTTTWEWSYGSTTAGEIYNGETFDSRIDDELWMTAESVEGWKKADILDLPPTELVTSESPPVRPYDELKPQEIITTPSGKTVFDLGQNFAGYVKVVGQPIGHDGDIITLKFAEVMEYGELGTRPLRGARATDYVILGGKVAGWEPRFTFHGFRYVQVDGWDGVTLSDIVGVPIASDMTPSGSFHCSHKLLNRLHQNVMWSTRSNTISVPTDCPQRDERLGWTGDIQVFAPTLNFLFDSSGFLRAWLRDLRADQAAANGVVPVVIPNVPQYEMLSMAHAVWGDVAALLPQDLYTAFADKDIVEESFESMVDWLERGIPRNGQRLWAETAAQFADWLAPSAAPDKPWDGGTDPYLVANAYLTYTTRVVARLAKLLGKDKEARKYDAETMDLLRKFHYNYVTPASRSMSDSQTAYALILHFDLVDPAVPDQRGNMAKRLGELVAMNKWEVATGFAGTPIILQALAENDMLHHAYRMLLTKTCPSWLSPVLLGATTIWERWDSMLSDGSINPGEMTSFNHYALGSVAAFMHSVIGGLAPMEPGWKRVLVKPRPNATLTHAEASHMSPYGTVSCSWRIEHGRFKVDVVVPPNTTAVVQLPGVKDEVGSGKWSYDVQWTEDKRWPPKPHPTGIPGMDNAGEWCP